MASDQVRDEVGPPDFNAAPARRPYAPAPGARRKPRRRWRLKRLIPQSLLGRSLMIIILPLVILQVISTWAFYDRHYENITRRLGLLHRLVMRRFAKPRRTLRRKRAGSFAMNSRRSR